MIAAIAISNGLFLMGPDVVSAPRGHHHGSIASRAMRTSKAPHVATSIGRVGVVVALTWTVSGVGFVPLTSCGNAGVGDPNKPRDDGGGSVTDPDSMVTRPDGAITHPDGADRDGSAVDSSAIDADGGSSSPTPDAGSDGPATGGCAAVPSR